jgi:Glycosyltransferases involved in cell wall biogenesis
MSLKPSITLVIPVCNSEHFLSGLFESLNAQTNHDFSCLFVFDQSEDNTLTVLKDLVSKTSLFSARILEKPVREGVGKARDFAIESRFILSPFVLFLDSDDLFSQDFIERMLTKAISSGADITLCGFKRIDEKDGHIISVDMIHNPPEITDLAHNQILPYLNPAPWNKLIKTDLIRDNRFIHRGGSGEDAMFFVKLLPLCHKIAFINEPLYYYRVSRSSVSGKTNLDCLQEAKEGYLEVRQYYLEHGDSYSAFFSMLEACIFLRVAIGETTRTCLSLKHHYHNVIKDTRTYIYSNFPNWKRNPFLSFGSCAKHGFKTLMIWRCKMLYRLNWFGLFVFDYKLFTRLFRKDIKW